MIMKLLTPILLLLSFAAHGQKSVYISINGGISRNGSRILEPKNHEFANDSISVADFNQKFFFVRAGIFVGRWRPYIGYDRSVFKYGGLVTGNYGGTNSLIEVFEELRYHSFAVGSSYDIDLTKTISLQPRMDLRVLRFDDFPVNSLSIPCGTIGYPSRHTQEACAYKGPSSDTKIHVGTEIGADLQFRIIEHLSLHISGSTLLMNTPKETILFRVTDYAPDRTVIGERDGIVVPRAAVAKISIGITLAI